MSQGEGNQELKPTNREIEMDNRPDSWFNNENDEENKVICFSCGGSGENHPLTGKCATCKGSGELTNKRRW